MELKRDHQLIRTGPYAMVRHPIYSGFMLAALGTAFVYGQLHELLAFVLILIAWTYKSRLEEAFLMEQFGAEYDQYRKQVKGCDPIRLVKPLAKRLREERKEQADLRELAKREKAVRQNEARAIQQAPIMVDVGRKSRTRPTAQNRPGPWVAQCPVVRDTGLEPTASFR